MITNGKIIGVNYDSREYTKSAHRRGSKEYVMSRSELMEFAVCPSRWIKGGRVKDETTSTEWGSLVDCLVTDAGRLSERYVVHPEKYPVTDKKGNLTGEEKPWNLNATWCKDWVSQQGDKACISAFELNRAQSAACHIISFLSSQPNDFQVFATADYQDDETGLLIPIKVLIDVVPKGDLSKSIIDIKTAKNGNPSKWSRTCFDHGYHMQGALQLDVYNAATGEQRDQFRHIVQENFPPYEVSKPWLDYTFISLGRQKYLHALQLYAQCLKTDRWPTYDQMQRENYNGWSVVSPEAYMVEPAPTIKDPEWMAA